MRKFLVFFILLLSTNSYAGVFEALPMPRSGIDSFTDGLDSSQRVFDSIAQNRALRQQIYQEQERAREERILMRQEQEMRQLYIDSMKAKLKKRRAN